MSTNDQKQPWPAVTTADQISNVFVALARGMRRCVICGRAFAREGAAEHIARACYLDEHFGPLYFG
jgi:hypothetical protein